MHGKESRRILYAVLSACVGAKEKMIPAPFALLIGSIKEKSCRSIFLSFFSLMLLIDGELKVHRLAECFS